DEDLVIRAGGSRGMRAGPCREFGIGGHVGKPRRHAVVMRDRAPQPRRCDRPPAGGRRRRGRVFLALGIAREGGLACRPRHGAVAVQGDIVDPAPLGVDRGCRELALGVDRDPLAVGTAGDPPPAGRGRAPEGTKLSI
ncbi:hypothetical protein CEE95_14765, partial [Lactobacillus crispatus]